MTHIIAYRALASKYSRVMAERSIQLIEVSAYLQTSTWNRVSFIVVSANPINMINGFPAGVHTLSQFNLRLGRVEWECLGRPQAMIPQTEPKTVVIGLEANSLLPDEDKAPCCCITRYSC